MKFNFLKSTLIFCAIGFFIPGFTAILFFLIQISLEKLGIDCETYWKYTITITSILSLISPFFYFKYLQKNKNPNRSNLLLFNISEYCFLQISLAQFCITSNTICFGQSDGALIFGFTAWIALPILVCFSFILQKTIK